MKWLFALVLLLLPISTLWADEGAKSFPYNYGIEGCVIGDKDPAAFYADCKKNGFDYIDLHPENYMMGDFEANVSGFKTTRAQLDKAGLKTWAIHLPYGNSFDISVTDENKRSAIVSSLSAYIREMAKAFSPMGFVLHPSGEPEPTGADRAAHIASAIKSVGELYRVAQAAGVTLCIENLPRTCLGNTPDELLQIVTATPGVRVCFDTNHYLTGRYDDFIRKVGPLIATLHVSDFDYSNEKHWLPGMGRLPFGELLLELQEVGYKGILMSEADRDSRGELSSPAEIKAAFDDAVKQYERVKASPSARAELWLKGLEGQYWYGTTPELAFPEGTAPGNYPAAKRTAFLDALNRLKQAIASGTIDATTFATMRNAVTAALDSLTASVVPIQPGYYYFKNGNSGFAERGKVMGLYSDYTKKLKWKAWTPSAQFLFRVARTNDGLWSVQNMANGYYISSAEGTSVQVPMGPTQVVGQVFKSLGQRGLFAICNANNALPYHAEGHRDGAGTAGNIVTWQGAAGSASSWFVEPVDEATAKQLMDEMDGPREALKAHLDAFTTSRCYDHPVAEVFPVGDEPGCYPQAQYDSFKAAYDREAAAANGTGKLTDAAVEQYKRDFDTALKALDGACRGVETGYYRIESAHFGFAEHKEVMAAYATDDNRLMWKPLEDNDNFIFYITRLGNIGYSIRNVGTGAYIGSQMAASTAIPLTPRFSIAQKIQMLGCFGMVVIFNARNSTYYHTQGHDEGAGTGGQVITWSSSPVVGSGSSWRLRKVDRDATGIAAAPTVNATAAAPAIFTTDGRLISDTSAHLAPGTYIVNGKKKLLR